MHMIRGAQEADFIFEVDGFSGELRVLNFSGNEGISELFSYGIHLASDDAAIDLDSIVGQPARLAIFYEDNERSVYGIVSRFEQSSRGEGFTPYYAQLVPKVWLLTQRYGCRIHQNLSVPDIIKKTLTDAGIDENQFRFALEKTYDPRVYCVQYRESDWNFISRLLEDEGIFYFFEEIDEGCKLVMGDSPSAHTPIETPDTVLFREASALVEAEDAVYEYRYAQEIRPGRSMLADYYFEKPNLDMVADFPEQAGRDYALCVYDYPGGYIDPDVGGQRAELALKTFQSRRIVGQGLSYCRRFTPGYFFTLDEHPRTDFNREYLLFRVSHTGVQPLGEQAVEGKFDYHNEFRCIPSNVPFLPARRTPRPIVQGTQTAIVTGPSREDIYPEKFGQAKVQFFWDREGQRDEKTSCWIRMAHEYAGKKHGVQFDPLIGDEVLVDFLEGDPDKPIIVGSVYNGDNLQKVDPTTVIKNIILTPYQHKLLFDDKGAAITLSTGGGEILNMAEGKSSSANGNNIKLSTADGHYAHLAGGSSLKGIEIKTAAGNVIRMDDTDKFVLIATTDGRTFIMDDTKKNTAIMSPAGQQIVLDDPAANLIQLQTGSNNMHMDDAGIHIWRGANHISITDGSIHLYHGGFHVLIDAGQVKIYNGGGMVRVAGDGVTATHGSKVELSVGGSKVSITPAGVEISGPQVKISGTGMVDIGGAMVKINS